MAVGCILRVSWFCLLLFGGSLPFPSMKGYSYTSKTDHPEIGGDKDDELQTSHTLMFDAYSQEKGYSDRSKKVPLAAAPKQAPLNPEEGARIQGGRAVEFGQKNAEMEDQKLVKPVTFPLNPPNQHDYSFEEQRGSTKPQFPKPSTKPSSKLAGSDLIPPTPYLLMDGGAFSSGPTLESKQVSKSGRYIGPTKNLNFQAGEQEGSQINADQPRRLSYVTYRTERGKPVISINSGNVAPAAPTISAQTLQADAVSRTDTKGGYSSSALYLDVQAGSQSYSPNLVYEDVFQYPAAETAQLPSEESDLSDYNSVNVVQRPSTWSSAPYMTREEEPVYVSNSGNVAPAAQTISAPALQVDAVSRTDTKGGYSSSSLHRDLPAGVQEGSQSYSPNLVYEDVFQYPAAETAHLPSEESDLSDYNSVNVVQRPSTWSSAPYMTREEEPVYVSNSGDRAQAAPTISEQPLEAEAVPSTDTKGGYSSSSLNLNFQAGAQEGSQSYSPNLVDQAVYQYPAAEAEQRHSEGVDASKYDSMNAFQPSTWSSASYMTKEEQPVFSSHTGDWAHVAPVETPAYPSYVADFGLDSTSSKAAAQPVLFRPLKKAPQLSSSKWLQRPKKARDQTASTYIVQSKGSHRRSRQMLSKKKYFSGFPPPPPFVLMALRP
ncbi:uncharacterized protein LOC132473414 [Gadus macrocephalus]|uniref:uncharacterized protein LOC132473414 n=1 Tax=Gadus macrocephalus TaxID=80720 RepID=UPI0028CB1D37|nr:uncharacterized protein LOC132473414 [Gadus macrocephalus]